MGTTHIVVDGSNIATEGRSLPSLQQLLEAVAAVAEDQKPATVTVIVDATFGHRIDKDEREAYDAKVSNGEIITPPAGVIGRGDAFILEVADRADAVVLSNDSFQEFHGDYRWLFDEGRLLGGKHVPGVGWIFLDRSPVRGPASRKATSAAKRKRKEATKAAAKPSSKGPDNKQSKGRGRSKKAATKQSTKAAPKPSGKEPEPYNELMPFLDFVGANEVGSVVEGEIEQFSSHGAYVMVGATRCYIPLKAMGDPPPRSARDVMAQGETKAFRVEAIDTPRRGIDLTLAEPVSTTVTEDDEPVAVDKAEPQPVAQPAAVLVTEADLDDPNLSVSQRRKLRAALAVQEAAAATESSNATEEAPKVSKPAKRSTKKSASKKSTSKRAPAAKKAAAKKPTTKKSTGRSGAKKAPAKKSAARSATTKKAAAKKATTKSGAKKSGAKKSATKGSAAKRSTAKKATAKKSGAKKAPAKRTAAKKATAKKSPAKKATSKKSTARKSTPRKR